MTDTLDCNKDGDEAEEGDHDDEGDQPGLAKVKAFNNDSLEVLL